MLNTQPIQRDYDQRHIDRLLQGLCRNGLPAPLAIQVRLGQSTEAVVALAMHRLAQLRYGPSPRTGGLKMAYFLIESQDAQGTINRDPLATAALVAGFGRWPDTGGLNGTELQSIAQARSRAISGLAALQADDGLFIFGDDRADEDRALVAAFIMYLLADDHAFRQTVRYADLSRWFEQRWESLDVDTLELWELSRISVATSAAGDEVEPQRSVRSAA
jgi:hypothetical protein